MYMAQHMVDEHGRDEIQQNHFQAPRHHSGTSSVKWVIGSIYSESASSISKSSISFQLWWYRSVSLDTQAPAPENTSLCSPLWLTKARGSDLPFGCFAPFSYMVFKTAEVLTRPRTLLLPWATSTSNISVKPVWIKQPCIPEMIIFSAGWYFEFFIHNSPLN